MKKPPEEERSFLARLVGGPPPPPPKKNLFEQLRENVSPTKQVEKVRKKVALALDNGLVAFAVVSGVVGLITATKKARIRVKEAQLQERLRRRSRLEAVRLKVAGPMRQAAHALERRIQAILRSTKNGTVLLEDTGTKAERNGLERQTSSSSRGNSKKKRFNVRRKNRKFAMDEVIERKRPFFEVDCTQRAVDSTLYLVCELMFWQYTMVRELQFEHVTEDDRWQFVVDAVLNRLGEEFQSAASDLLCGLQVDYVKEMNIDVDSTMNIFEDVAQAEGDKEALTKRKLYPLRMTQHERVAVGELMRGDRDLEDGHMMPLSFTAFVERNLYAEDLAKKLQASRSNAPLTDMEDEEIVQEIKNQERSNRSKRFLAADALDGIKKGNTTLESQDISMLYRWAIWVLPMRHQLVLLARFQAMDVLCLSLEELRFLTRSKLRMRRIAVALREVLDVLDRPPDDPFFRKKNKAEIRVEGESKKERKAREKARYHWNIIKTRKVEILCYIRLGIWPPSTPPKKKRRHFCTIM